MVNIYDGLLSTMSHDDMYMYCKHHDDGKICVCRLPAGSSSELALIPLNTQVSRCEMFQNKLHSLWCIVFIWIVIIALNACVSLIVMDHMHMIRCPLQLLQSYLGSSSCIL